MDVSKFLFVEQFFFKVVLFNITEPIFIVKVVKLAT